MSQDPSDRSTKPATEERLKLDKSPSSATCARCGGTGLVCGSVPIIGPENCCVDYANAFCPDCKGTGVRPV